MPARAVFGVLVPCLEEGTSGNEDEAPHESPNDPSHPSLTWRAGLGSLHGNPLLGLRHDGVGVSIAVA
ncbi:MAG: hypothetical protein MPN21_05610 [Thermoanaerobaculia bacterium]|nr:hypothetical protein [Thermoanaerobaculia bacterium]